MAPTELVVESEEDLELLLSMKRQVTEEEEEDEMPLSDERQWLSAGYAWHSRPRTTTLSSNLRNGGDESG